MYEYLSDMIMQMRQSIVLVGSRDYKIPVVCILTYALSDVYALKSSGRVNDRFTLQNLAEEYFGRIIDDITTELGADDIKNFKFIVRSYVDETAELPTISMIVDTKGTVQSKNKALAKKAKIEALSHTQKQYVEDMISRSAKKYLNR